MPTLSDVSVVIPYRRVPGHRERLVAWTLRRYAELMPELEVVLGMESTTNRCPLFCRSEAINRGIAQTKRDVILIADADVAASPQCLQAAAHMVNDYGWVLPYQLYCELDEITTRRLLAMDVSSDLNALYHKQQFTFDGIYKTSQSSLALITRDNFVKSGGFDERFKGWAPEDQAWADAVSTLCGKPGRVRVGHLYHLWHPVAKGTTKDNPFYVQSERLWKRYKKAAGDQDVMAKLVAERR